MTKTKVSAHNIMFKPWYSLRSCRSDAVLIGTLILLASGCSTITRPLTVDLGDTEPAACAIEVGEIQLTAPKLGDNIFLFEDILNTSSMSGANIITIRDYKRAEFHYVLERDSAPELKRFVSDVFSVNPEKKSRIALFFNFYLTKATTMKNTLVLVVAMNVSTEGEPEANFGVKVIDSYSTFPVTYPSTSFLNGMLAEGVNTLKSEVCGAGA